MNTWAISIDSWFYEWDIAVFKKNNLQFFVFKFKKVFSIYLKGHQMNSCKVTKPTRLTSTTKQKKKGFQNNDEL